MIVPAYNAALTIGRALDSVARQTEKPREVVVVDDGSSDDTAAAARACADIMGGVALIVIEQPNRGAGAARNRAIAAAKGSYLAFLDADDEWLPEKLERSLCRFARGTLKLVAHNGWIVADGHVSEIDIERRFRASAGDLIHGFYRRGFISTSSVVAQRHAVIAAGGFDEELRTGQDFDLWLKMLCEPGTAFEVFGDKLTRYHISPDGITGKTGRRLANTLTIALRYAPRLHRHTGRFVASLWFRIVALHVEACAAFWRNREFGAAARTLGLLPARIVSLTAQAMFLVQRDA